MDGASYIDNSVQSNNAVGNAGNINITTGSLSATNGAEINSFTRGQGNAGNVTITATDAVTFDGVDKNRNPSGSFSTVLAGGVGNGGKIDITAGSLSLTNGGELGVSVNEASGTLAGGQGSGGTINLNVRDALTVSGTNSGISAQLNNGATGRGGDIKIQARDVFVTDGGQIISTASGQGDAGNISITARNGISLDGASYIANIVRNNNAVGNAGNINITTGSLSATNGAEINSFTRGHGNAGNVTITATDAVTFDGVHSGSFSTVLAGGVGNGGNVKITAGTLSLTNGGELDVSVYGVSGNLAGGQGNGGTVNLNVRDALTISGTNSGIFADLDTGATGRGGDILVQAGNILVTDGGQIKSTTSGQGDSGNISITARNGISLSGNSGILSSVADGGVGNGADIQIQARSLSLDNSILSTGTLGGGNSGNITLSTDSLSLTNHGFINSSTFGQGDAGNISLTARNGISLSGDSGILSSVATSGGNGADIQIQARSLSLDNSVLSTGTFLGRGNSGNITLSTDSLSLTNNGTINSSTFGQGDAGNVTITATNALTISGTDSGIFAQLNTGATGRGGDILVQAGNILVTDGGQISSTTSGQGDSGNISITARNGISLDGASYIANSVRNNNAVGNAGNVNITTGSLSATNGAQINSFTRGHGNAGNVTITATDAVTFDGVGKNRNSSGSFSTVLVGGVGNGGKIDITAGSLSLTNGGQLGVSVYSNSVGQGKAGNVNIFADTVRLNKGQITAQTVSGDGGNINFNLSQYLLLRNNSLISATAGTAEKGGNGGNITINTPFLIAVPNENSDITANAFTGYGGNVRINTQGIFGIQARQQLTPQSDITASSQFGVTGQIAINQPDAQPTQGLIQLPSQVLDASNQIGQVCPRGASARRPLGEFIITGRGSLPPSPLEPLASISYLSPLATLDSDAVDSNSSKHTTIPQSNFSAPVIPNQIIEATGWVVNSKGEVTLISRVPNANSLATTLATCPAQR